MPHATKVAGPTAPTPDYIVRGEGSVYLIVPQNDKAHRNLVEGVGEGALWWGDAIAVEHRFIGPLVTQLRDEGWTI